MTIETARQEDYRELKDLWSIVFDEEPGFLERFFTTRFDPDHIVLAREDGKIVSALHARPATYCKGDRIDRCTYIVGAATYREYRKRGIMGALLERTRKITDCPLTLFPAVRQFYEHHRYFTTSQVEAYRLLQTLKGPFGRIEPSIAALDAVYRTATTDCGALMRDPLAWEFLMDGYDSTLAVEGAYAFVKNSVAVEAMAIGLNEAKALTALLEEQGVRACHVLPGSPFATILQDGTKTPIPMGMATDPRLRGCYIAEQY